MNNKVIVVALLLSGLHISLIAMDKEKHLTVASIQPIYWRVRDREEKIKPLYVPQASLLYSEGPTWRGSSTHFLSLIDEEQLLARVIGLEKVGVKRLEDDLSRKPEKQPKNINIVNGIELDLDDID